MNIIACVVDTFEISLSNCWWKMKGCANYIVHMNFDRNMVPHYGSVSLTVMKILHICISTKIAYGSMQYT